MMPDEISLRAGEWQEAHIIGLPASKSIANRAMLLNELLPIKSTLSDTGDSADTLRMQSLLAQIRENRNKPSAAPLILDAGDAGTVMRFLLALLAISPGEYLLTGSERMLKRPVRELVDALITLGADISYAGETGFPPLRIRGKAIEGGKVQLSSSISSQYISALMMIGPAMKNGIEIIIPQGQVSKPYIRMTAGLMRQLGVDIDELGEIVQVGRQVRAPAPIRVEADWSSASYWYESLALSARNSVSIRGLSADSLQGDAFVREIFHKFGISTKFEEDLAILEKTHPASTLIQLDLTEYPDLAPALACTAAGLGIEIQLSGIAHLRYKESDRIEALSAELSKLGCDARTDEVSLSLKGRVSRSTEVLETHKDHRMAMALAPLTLVCGPMRLSRPEVVRKSYPGYWEELQKGFGVIFEL